MNSYLPRCVAFSRKYHWLNCLDFSGFGMLNNSRSCPFISVYQAYQDWFQSCLFERRSANDFFESFRFRRKLGNIDRPIWWRCNGIWEGLWLVCEASIFQFLSCYMWWFVEALGSNDGSISNHNWREVLYHSFPFWTDLLWIVDWWLYHRYGCLSDILGSSTGMSRSQKDVVTEKITC